MENRGFVLKSKFKPAGDQPSAISGLLNGFKSGKQFQTLLGVTGSGKTFTTANIINTLQKPTLVIAHNKTLAAQLTQEYRSFFPENAVHYFVSYYDYYQPEAYIPVTDTYIEKEAQINKEIDRLRHASTQALLTRRDVIIVASVSCIYGLGSPEEYKKVNKQIKTGMKISRKEFINELIEIHYSRTLSDISAGNFRALGNVIELIPVSEAIIYRIEFDGENISKIIKIEPVSKRIISEENELFIFPAKHFITREEEKKRAIDSINTELKEQLRYLLKNKKMLEAERLKRKTRYDLAMIREVGYCNGIENYSRHFSGKQAGDPPDTLLSYFPRLDNGKPDFLTVIDESHVTIPQIKGMFAGDKSRKETLISHGFRLPSARDNRPLKFSEFEKQIGQVLFTSATPGSYELGLSKNPVEQVIRPTGLIDPAIEVRPVGNHDLKNGQIQNFVIEAEKAIKKGQRVIATTLTKKMAEDLSAFLKEKKLKTEYLHSDIETLDRIGILTKFRNGSQNGGFDCLVGVNLLREGLDLPEVALIGILDADRAGFLRSSTSLIQIIGRAARNISGRVILYADKETDAIKEAITETNRRRSIQIAYNKKHKIIPKTIIKKISDLTETLGLEHKKAVATLLAMDKLRSQEKDLKQLLKERKKQLNDAVKRLDFETAALLRDEILEIEKLYGK